LSANLDLVRSIYAAHERGDYSSAEWAHPEIELVIVEGPSPGSWKGLGEMAEGVRDFLSAWEDWHSEPEEYRELDGERVLALTRGSGRGRTSGLEIEQLGAKTANVFHVREGRVTRLVIYSDRDRAFADLGMEG
jgi:ketosteroid isomerase-like protein